MRRMMPSAPRSVPRHRPADVVRVAALGVIWALVVLSGCALAPGPPRPTAGAPAVPDTTLPTPADILSLGSQRLHGRWGTLPNAPAIRGKQDDVFFANALTGWSVNGLGNIYKTDDGGETSTTSSTSRGPTSAPSPSSTPRPGSPPTSGRTAPPA